MQKMKRNLKRALQDKQRTLTSYKSIDQVKIDDIELTKPHQHTKKLNKAAHMKVVPQELRPHQYSSQLRHNLYNE